jgi:hypothetical protein
MYILKWNFPEQRRVLLLVSDKNWNIYSTFNFAQLKTKNISIFDLLTCSAPIDLLERYAAYFINSSDVNTDSEEVFLIVVSYGLDPSIHTPLTQNNPL